MYINAIEPYGEGKFRPGEIKTEYDIWGNKMLKQTFIPTQGYMKYLKAKEAQKRKFEITKLKAKLDYEFTTTGEVDDIDYQRYCKLIVLTK